jgi:DNA-binding MarR family transcriptional regulator
MASAQRLAILDHLSRVPDACAEDLGKTLGLTMAAAGMQLLRLTRAGLVTRSFDAQDGCYFHALTPKGRQRLAYLRGGPR